MDEAGRLIGELQQKLKELDHRVWLYRRDMTLEFTKYAETLLRDVPHDVSSAVSVAIAQSLKDHCSLWPPHEPSDLLQPASISDVTDAMHQKVAMPITLDLQHASTDLPRSPHAREQEFQGLFTPSYLPLLDSSNGRHDHRPSDDHNLPAPTSEMPDAASPAASPTRRASSLSPIALDRMSSSSPPSIKRRSTDDSASSSAVESPVRRSALRHAAGFVKIQSPRRVRFEFAGKEFETTSSPKQATPIASEFPTTFDEEPETEQIEYVEPELSPSPPPPPRVSSSQALRALSRQPLEDDGTQWTQVSAPPDGSASVPVIDLYSDADDDDDDAGFEFSSRKANGARGATPDQPVATEDDHSAHAACGAAPTVVNGHHASPQKPSKPMFSLDMDAEEPEPQPAFDDPDDVLFQFDESQSSPARPLEIEQYSDLDSPPDSPLPDIDISQYSTSPARAILAPKPVRNANGTSDSSSQKGSLAPASIHPFNTPVVNEIAHAQAASLGTINSFVGSLRDSSEYKYQPSTPIGSSVRLGQHPLTMLERMRIDDLADVEPEQ